MSHVKQTVNEAKLSTNEFRVAKKSICPENEAVNYVHLGNTQYTPTSSGKKERPTDLIGTAIKFVSLQCQGGVQVR